MVIDAHSHLQFRGDTIYTPEHLFQSMEDAGISHSLVIAEQTENNPTGVTNEEVITIAQNNPRIHAIGNIDFVHCEDSIAKLTRFLGEKKIVGVKLYPGYQNFYPNNEKLFPLYEYCQSNNYPVVFHTGLLEIGYPGLLKQTQPLEIDEVAYRYPQLKIVLAHLGNPWLIDCAAVMYKNPNVYADFSALTPEGVNFSEEDSEDMYNSLMEVRTFLGSFEKCLFGTDWPLYSQKDYLNASITIPMTDEEKELVFSQNAINIFNLEV